VGAAAAALIRAALDTNVLVSAMLFRGVSSRIFVAWRTGKFRLATEEVRSLLEAGFLPFSRRPA
jgi:predicted nucleic acid-binding protein